LTKLSAQKSLIVALIFLFLRYIVAFFTKIVIIIIKFLLVSFLSFLFQRKLKKDTNKRGVLPKQTVLEKRPTYTQKPGVRPVSFNCFFFVKTQHNNFSLNSF